MSSRSCASTTAVSLPCSFRSTPFTWSGSEGADPPARILPRGHAESPVRCSLSSSRTLPGQWWQARMSDTAGEIF